MKLKAIIFLLCFFCAGKIFSQGRQLFTLDSFIQQIKLYHPVAKQSDAMVQRAAAEVLSNRGAFDPSFLMDASRKTFDGKNYYYYTNPELKIPTWIGIDVKAGLEKNGGSFIDPEYTVGKTSYLGIEMPLAKGLVMDKRRAALQQAKIFRDQSLQEQLAMINDLLFDAYNAYWAWAGYYQLYSLYTQYYSVAQQRFRFVKIAFVNGDRSAMDTVEALTQVQNFEMLLYDAQMKLNDASFDLSNYLWNDDDSSYTLPPQNVPDTLLFASYMQQQPAENIIQQAVAENPVLRSYNYKLDALTVERKLKFQNLLPVVNAKANLLNSGYNVFNGLSSTLLENNYKWGIDIKVPLFLREGRGDYKQAKLKIQETNYQLNFKRTEIENKIRSYSNQEIQLNNQLQTAVSAYNNYVLLLRQENIRFSNGESSLFLVNTRENKVIETAQKITELRIKYLKAHYAVLWSAGLLR